MRAAFVILGAISLCACGLVGESSLGVEPGAKAVVFEGPVPRAECGPGDRPEPGTQGRANILELRETENRKGYWCNLTELGKETGGATSGQGTKALWQMAWYEDCAYYGISIGQGGVGVVDVSDPKNPVRTDTLMTPAMLDPWETLKVADKRHLLGAVGTSAAGPLFFDLYDVGEDCAAPGLIGSFPVNAVGHEGEWAPDGQVYYGSTFWAPEITAIDVANAQTPRPMVTMNAQAHGLSISDDGTRAYLAQSQGGNGLRIIDVSAIHSRDPAAAAATVQPTEIGSTYWDDGATAQMTIPVKIGGKPFVIFIDEGGSGMARIIDISDEKNPVVVSKLKNEINMPEAEEERTADGGASGFTYQGHYCGVPQRDEPGIVGCTYFWQGLRVFDIRDPYHPREIAYYVPPPLESDTTSEANAASAVRFIPERGEVWFTNQNTGFHVLKFREGVWPFAN